MSEAVRGRATVAWWIVHSAKPAKIAKLVGWKPGRVYRLQAAMKSARDALPLVMNYTRGRWRKYSAEQLREVEELLRERQGSYSPTNLDAAQYAVLAGKRIKEWGGIVPTITQIAARTGVDISTVKKLRAKRRLPLPSLKYRRRFKATLRLLELYHDPNSQVDPDSIKAPSGRRKI